MHHFGHLEPHTISNQQRPIMKKTEKIQSKSNSNFWNQQRSIMKKQKKSKPNPNPTFGPLDASFWSLGKSTKANYEKTEKNPILGIFLLI